MVKISEHDQGFEVVSILIAVFVILAIAGSGYVIYNKNKNSDTNNSQTHSTSQNKSSKHTPKATDPTADWVMVNSIGGAYSIKIPDGWMLTNYPDNVLNGDSLTFSTSKPATIKTESIAYAGDQRKFNVGVAEKQSGQPDGPQWQSPSPYGTEATTDFSIGSLKGKRYSIEYTQTVTGITKGDKIYQYVFDLPNGKQLGVVYMQNVGDTNNLNTVEQAIKTIVIK